MNTYGPLDNVDAPNIGDATREFLLAYVFPSLDPDRVFRGWDNPASLPPVTDGYAVIAEIREERRGTNVHEYVDGPEEDPGDGVMVIWEYIEAHVRLEFGSATEEARQRAGCVETLARDDVGWSFFHDRGFDCLFADTPASEKREDGGSVWSTTLHLGYRRKTLVPVPSFGEVEARIENVDVHHPLHND